MERVMHIPGVRETKKKVGINIERVGRVMMERVSGLLLIDRGKDKERF